MFNRSVNALCGIVLVALVGQQTPNLAGTWVFNAVKSQNIGMMASAEIVSTVTQSPTLLVVRDASNLNGTRETRYDLTGAATENEAPMGERARTTSKWVGNKLVTTWESDGAVAGTKVVRTETRYVSADGKMMFVESVRGTDAPLVIAFDRK